MQKVAIVVCSLLLAGAGMLQAGVVAYSDRASWEAASAGLTNISFSGYAVPPNICHSAMLSNEIFAGLSFMGAFQFWDREDPVCSGNPNIPAGLGYGSFLAMGNHPSGGAINFPDPVSSVGFYWATEPGGKPGWISARLGSWGCTTITVPGQVYFCGLVTDTPETQLILTGYSLDEGNGAIYNAPAILFDEFAYGDEAVTPEPSALVLSAAGLVTLMVLRRRPAARQKG